MGEVLEQLRDILHCWIELIKNENNADFSKKIFMFLVWIQNLYLEITHFKNGLIKNGVFL